MFKPLFLSHVECCHFCNESWGKCRCKFVSPKPNEDDLTDFVGFDAYEGDFFITNPNVSIDGCHFVDPTVEYGSDYNDFASSPEGKEYIERCAAQKR